VRPAPVAAALVAWFRRHHRDLPWRRTRDPYRVWVSEIMLQQTTVKAVVPYFERFVRRFPDVRRLARARPSDVLASWSGLGYYRRARHLHAAAAMVVERHAGRVPARREELLALPGIGRYTAGAILSIAYGRPEPIVDGNVTRVLCRLAGERGDPRRAGVATRLWDEARRLVEAAASPGDLNEALMELGATVCTPAAPDCPACPLARPCVARAAGRQEAIPPPRARVPTVLLRQRAALIERDGRLLLRRRPATGLMDDLWEVPLLETAAGGRVAAGGTVRLAAGGPRVRLGGRVGIVRHAVTYRRIEVEIVAAAVLSEPRGGYRWVDEKTLARLPVSSLVGKILTRAGTGRARPVGAAHVAARPPARP
jgi:A/G-specific adenine glycosylase